MNGIAQPATSFASKSDASLREMFYRPKWQSLDETSRLELLQEIVNREVEKNGGQYFCKVEFCDLPSNTSGEQRGNTICLNRQMFVEDRLTEVYNGREIEYRLPDSNYNAYETVLHEHQHVKQDMIASGLIPSDPDTRKAFQANAFTESDIDGKAGSQYMLGVTDYSLYYLNPTELDAYKTSQTATKLLVAEQSAKYGEDFASAHYLRGLAANGYEARLLQYRELYRNEHIDKDIEDVLISKYFHDGRPLDPGVEKLVETEMIESQKLIDANNTQKELSAMGKQTFTENGYTFEVEDNGTTTANGRVNEDPASRSGMSKINPNGYDNHVHDKGHLIAAREGGPAKGYNVSAQDRTLNRGAYKSVENAEVRLANKGYDVQTSKTAYVSNPGSKPDAYMVNDTITSPEGETQHVHISFQNASPADQEAWNDESAEAFSQMADEYDNPNSRPEGMSESEYAELMESTDSELDSVKDEFDMSSTSETSFDNCDDSSDDYSSEASSGAEDGCDDGLGL